MKKIKQQFEDSVMAIIIEFEKKQGFDFDFAVSNDLSGVLCFGDEYSFCLSDICKDIFTDQPKGLIMQWQDDSILNYKQKIINYNSYTMGLRYEKRN